VDSNWFFNNNYHRIRLLDVLSLSFDERLYLRILLVFFLVLIATPTSLEERKQPDNIKQCFTCFLKKFSDWTWEQEKRLGKREDPKYITCRRYKRKQAKSGQQVCLYKGANDTYQLVVEGQCPVTYQCKYDPHGKEPNIDSVVDSLNDSFKK
tara:strand:- start:428 stop:883 length:456 start_codon:yes stop_codon:yes gene_type:complete